MCINSCGKKCHILRQMDLQILKFAISEDLGDRYPHVIVNDLKTKCKHPVVELEEYKKKILPELSCVGLV